MAKKEKKKGNGPLIPTKYVEAVARGVQFLDLVFGRNRWLKRMDMSNFDINHGSVCVAGNVFKEAWKDGESDRDSGYGRFCELMEALDSTDGEKAATRFGFIADSDRGMQHLQDLWVMTVMKLKAKKNVPGIARAI